MLAATRQRVNGSRRARPPAQNRLSRQRTAATLVISAVGQRLSW
jgi:hypothetical protein